MSDDGPVDDREAEAERARERTRQSAQDAAADLARMGIDPRSLGLDGPSAASGAGTRQATEPPAPEPTTGGPTARIVPIRPDLPSQAPTARDAVVPRADPSTTPSWTTPDDAGTGRHDPVAQMIARTAQRKPAPRSPGSLLRTVGRGVLTPDAAEAAGVERELVAAVRQRQTERRVVAFAGGRGGVGTTSVLSGVASAFAALREDRSAALDLQPGAPSLGRALGVAEPLAAPTVLRRADSLEELPRTSAGLAVVDGPPWEQPLQRRDLAALLDRVGADHAFNLVDVGRDPGDAAHAALARCDQAVLVTGVGEQGVSALEVVRSRLQQINPPAAERAVVVVVCRYADSYRRAHREIVARVAVAPERVVVVPPDVHLAQGGMFDASLVGAATREAMLEVAAAVALSGGSR
ncbi:hypothetical protein [Solicola sp. PLA-1-18]|uniref:hypothetical protein n=1 Tax=Solicola sp. PLA-1-18 TaxID=3380532 RepID=UPI003B797D38